MFFNRFKKLLYLVVLNTLLATSAWAVSVSTITSPTNGSTLTSSTQTFYWQDTGSEAYHLYIGTSQGGYDIYAANQGTATSRTIYNLPTSGTIYVRLYTWMGSYWDYRDYTYQASGSGYVSASSITSPTSGTTFTSSTQTFYWQDTGSEAYHLYIGTSQGGYDIYAANQGTATSRTIYNLPTSGTIYVRLYTWMGSYWDYRDYSYQMSTSSTGEFNIPSISEAQKAEYLDAINTIRAQPQNCGTEGYFPAVHALSWSDALYNAAYEHNYDLANSGTFSHTGSGTIYDITAQNLGLNRGSYFYERIANYNYNGSTSGENIAAGQSTLNEVMSGWMASDGHCANIMSSNFREIGMALLVHNSGYRYYWAQNFGG